MPRRRRRVDRSGEPVTAAVEDLDSSGRGVVRVNGKAVLIDGALPGETVRFRYTATHRHYDEGAVEDVVEPSADRIEPRCEHFGVCGGCALQHLAPAAQLAAKETELHTNLRRIGKLEPGERLPRVEGPLWGYRRKARLGVKHVARKGGVLVGFRERGGRLIADLHHCHILHPAVGERLPLLAELIGSMDAYNRIPQIEVAAGDDCVALVVRHLDALSEADRVRLSEFASAHGFTVFLQPGGPETVHPLNDPSNGLGEDLGLDASGRLAYALPAFDVELRFAPTDFVQVNAEVNRRMVEQAVAQLAPGPQDRVLDLFCGIGNFSLPLARSAGHVLGIEGDAGLIERARDNARANGIDNVELRTGDLARHGDQGLRPGEHFTHALLDPPRSGAIEVLGRLPEMGVRRIVYVSCHPATLARDVGYLVHDFGYTLESNGVLDMFPHTAHVEAMAVLSM